jgi:hypothetical protein
MERQDFARIATRISSLAAELQLLAQSVVEDKLTGNYARAHVEHLEEEVHDQEAELDRPAPPGLDAQPLRELRTRLQEELTQAKRHLSEAPAMSRVAAEAGRIRDEARSRTPPK